VVVASKDTVELIYEVLRHHVSSEQMEAIIADLQQVPGNKSFRDTVSRLVQLDTMKRRD
jgi:hypothetical protein